MTVRRRRWPRAMLLAVTALLVALAWKTGWLSAPEPWQQATGWARIPVELRPQSDRLWSQRRGDPPPTVRWLGHSGFLIRWRDTSILLDPNVSPRCTISRRVLAERPALDSIGPIDAALISHAHFDHLDLPSLRSVSDLAHLVVPRGAETYLDTAEWPTTRIHSLQPNDRLRVGRLEVVAVSAAHNGNRLHPLASRELAVGYVIRTPGSAIYYSGDTGPSNDFAAVRRHFHPRAALLPIGAYSPRWPMQLFHLSPETAVRAAQELAVEVVVPCHFGTFTVSLDRPADALPRFARAASEAGLRWVMPQLPSAEAPEAAS